MSKAFLKKLHELDDPKRDLFVSYAGILKERSGAQKLLKLSHDYTKAETARKRNTLLENFARGNMRKEMWWNWLL